MVERMSHNSMDSSAMKSSSRSNNKGGLKDFFKQQEARQQKEHTKSHVRRPKEELEGDTSDDNSIDLFDNSSNRKEKPCYSDRFHDSCDSMEESVASFMSRSMLHEESPTARTKRRNRLQQMKADRELVAKLEQANQALEEEVNKKAQNKPLNTFFSGNRKKAQPFGPAERPPSPLSKSASSVTKKILKKKILLPLNKPRRVDQQLNMSMPILSAENFLGMDQDDDNKKKEEAPEMPALRTMKDDFDLGRDRNRANIGRQRRVRPSRTISGAGSGRRQRPMRNPPAIQEIDFH